MNTGSREPSKLFCCKKLATIAASMSLPLPPIMHYVIHAGAMMLTFPIQLARCGLIIGILMTLATCRKPFLEMDSEEEAWTGTEDGEDVFNGPAYSVIVVASNPSPSNLFRDEQRVRYFNRLSGRRDVVSVQFGDPSPNKPPGIDEPPFGARHADGVDKRVRLIFRPDVGHHRPSGNQVRRVVPGSRMWAAFPISKEARVRAAFSRLLRSVLPHVCDLDSTNFLLGFTKHSVTV